MILTKQDLRMYALAVRLWSSRRYDTAEIAVIAKLPESVIASWIANFRDTGREAA